MLADRGAKLRRIGLVMLRFLIGDDEPLYIRLAVKASKPLDVCINDVEAIAGMFSFQRIVNDAVPVGAADSQSVRLIVGEMIRASKAAVIFLQRTAAIQAQDERDQRHTDRNAVGGLAEIGCPPVAVERDVEFADARQGMQQACLGKISVLKKTLN